MITARRLEFLRTIKEIYESSSLPVHYVKVAEKMGISKWSAYEMLKSLERDGLLSRHYEVNSAGKHPGRSMILFAPTRLLVQIVNAAATDVQALTPEWQQIKQRLLSVFDQAEPAKTKALLDQLARELPEVNPPLVACAYVATLLIAQLHNLGENGLGVIRIIMKGAVKAESGLAMLAGAIMGLLARAGLPIQIVSHLSSLLPGFQKNLASLDKGEQELLMEFVDQALDKAA